MVVMHVVGNRPQFIKLAPVSREIRKRNIKEIIIHTGQHYDQNMSDIFFEELGIPKPTKNLNIGSGTHAEMTAKAMIELERVMLEYQPERVIVYGDTDSTLAAAIVAAKLTIPIIHVEAGPRTYNEKNPEEQNRTMVDHLSTYLCTPDRKSVTNLEREGIKKDKIHFTGDVMYDEFLYCLAQNKDNEYLKKFPDEFVLMTWHRQENTSDKVRMEHMIDFMEKVSYPIVLPLHPRTRKMLYQFGLYERIENNSDIIVIDPVGYKEMTMLLSCCKVLISDSGGASKEASFVGKRCLYTLDLEVWPDLIKADYIKMIDVDNMKSVIVGLNIVNNIKKENMILPKVDFFGDGNAAKKIVDLLEK